MRQNLWSKLNWGDFLLKLCTQTHTHSNIFQVTLKGFRFTAKYSKCPGYFPKLLNIQRTRKMSPISKGKKKSQMSPQDDSDVEIIKDFKGAIITMLP